MDHAHMRIRDTLLLHWLLFERLDQVFEAVGPILLIVHSLLVLQS